jgi:heterodisulfide reductase subunit A
MTAALSLADQGFEVHLVEKEKELGGNLRNLFSTLSGDDPQKLLQETIEKVRACKKIHLHLNTSVKELSGYMGNYKTALVEADARGRETVIEHGAVVLATGGAERETNEYLYGHSERVVTQKELEARLSDEGEREKLGLVHTVAMIQCVGSREEGKMYCSRVCCAQAIKNALKIKELSPQTDVIIFYRDIRTYGFREEYYQKARQEGIIFVRYEPDNKPKVTAGEGTEAGLQVEAFDPILGQKLCLAVDLLVLSTGIAPRADSEQVAKMLKVPLDQDGFFLEAPHQAAASRFRYGRDLLVRAGALAEVRGRGHLASPGCFRSGSNPAVPQDSSGQGPHCRGQGPALCCLRPVRGRLSL